MKILLLTPMPPDRTAPGAIPAVLHAQLRGLAAQHDVAVVTIAGPNERELAAVDRLVAEGFEVHAARRVALSGAALRAQRRWRAATWVRSGWPWRTVSFWAPSLEGTIDRLLAEDRFDVVAVEDSAMGVYCIPTGVPCVYTEHEVRRAGWAPDAPDGARGVPVWLAKQVNWRRWADHQLAIWRACSAST